MCDSCYNCSYAGIHRQGDITLGDFWSYVSKDKVYRNDDKGINLIMMNTTKGEVWLESIRGKLILIEATLDEAAIGNHTLTYPTKRAKKTNDFWKIFLRQKSFEECIPKYLYPTSGRSIKSRLKMWLDDHFYLLPRPIQTLYIDVRRWYMEKK